MPFQDPFRFFSKSVLAFGTHGHKSMGATVHVLASVDVLRPNRGRNTIMYPTGALGAYGKAPSQNAGATEQKVQKFNP